MVFGIISINITKRVSVLEPTAEVIKVHETVINNQLNKIIKSYMKPLSENFPNHEVEIQVEIEKQVQPPAQLFPRKRVFVYKPGAMVRAGPASTTTKTTTRATTKTTTHKTVPLATDPPKTPSMSTAKMKKPTQSTRQPVYREDLKRALDELEKKLNMRAHTQGPDQLVISSSGPVHENQDINRIIELMKKGVHFQRHVPKPEDGDLEWMQIKIPKY